MQRITCNKIIQAVSAKYSKCETQMAALLLENYNDLNRCFLLMFKLSSSALPYRVAEGTKQRKYQQQ
jgi:hypothetical protein